MASGWIARGPDAPAASGATDIPVIDQREAALRTQSGGYGLDGKPVGPAMVDTQTPAPPGGSAPAPRGNAIEGWKPVGPDQSLEAVRAWKPVGPDKPMAPKPITPIHTDYTQPGILSSVADSIKDEFNRATSGPDWETLAKAYPHVLKAQLSRIGAGYQETVGASQVQSAEMQAAALNVLPQVAARLKVDPQNPAAGIQAMAQDPIVKKTAIGLGLDPQVFASQYPLIAGMSAETQADAMSDARDTMLKGQDNVLKGKDKRLSAWADEKVWQPSDLMNGKLDPWTVKGLAFNTALAIPELAAVAGTTVGTTALTGNPGLGVAAGGATAVALFAPAQREQVKDKIDDQVGRLLEKADALDDAAPIGGKRGLNPVTSDLRQQAHDLAASSDKIANTAGFLYALSDVAGSVPVASVLAKSPAGKAVLDRLVGATVAKTAGGRVAGAMVANGAGGIVQASIQKAVDAGIVHEQTTLKDALQDIAYTGVVSAVTAAPIAVAHEVSGAGARAEAKRNLDADELLNRVRTASENVSAAQAGPTASADTYPGYQWNDASGKYEKTGPSPTTRQIGTETPNAGTKPPPGEAPGAPGETFAQKQETLNTAAAKAEKRSDVTLEPEEEGWSVHVNGEQVAKFDNVTDARQAMATARKVVGTAPAVSTPVETPVTTGKKPTTFRDITESGTGSPTKTPETPLEQTQPIPAERRTQGALRQRVSDMTPEQAKAALLTHELTGIPNRRAYEDSEKKPAQVSVDVDSLKWVNDNAGHAGGDELLKSVAQALHEETGGNAYHISGDEFVVQGDDAEQAERAMARAKDRLAGATLTFKHPDGRTVELKGVGLSHGTGSTLQEAEGNLATAKGERQAQGLRAPRGEQPPGASVALGQAGVQTGRSQAPAEEKGLTQKGKPRIVERANWHGLPIGIENPAGSIRTFKNPDGSAGRRKMRVPYGEFTKTEGADGDGVDVFMGGSHPDNAFVIDQLDPTGKNFDEHKVILGTKSAEAAKQLYLDHYQKGWKGFGAITKLKPAELKDWLHNGDTTKPIAWKPRKVPVAPPRLPPNPKRDSILQYLARHPEGIDSEEAQAQGIDPEDMKLRTAHVGIQRAFRKGGMSFDHAAEHLAEQGYPVTDSHGHYNPNTLLDRLSDELAGRPHYSVHNEKHTEALAQEEAERQQMMADDAAAHHIAPGVPDLENEPQEVIDWTVLADRARKVDADATERALERDDDNIARAELEDIVRRGESSKIGLERSEAQGEGAPAAARSHADQEVLASYTEEELAERERASSEVEKAEAAAVAKAAIDKAARQPLELTGSARPSDANPRQADLLSLARRPPSTVGEQTTRYEVREPPRAAGKASNLRPAGGVRQLDIFANADLPAPAVGAAKLSQSVKLAHIGEFRSGVKQVKGWEDAAHILAPLRKNPQENMAALVLDKDGKPLAVIRHSIGQVAAASVEAWSLAGSIVQVKGAAAVYFAHNHPSGRLNQSMPDELVASKLHNLLEGSGIKAKGMIVVSPGQRSASHFYPNQGHVEQPITAARRTGAVPLLGRRIAKVAANPMAGETLNNFEAVARAIKATGEKSGVLLVSQSNKMIGVVPMQPTEMMKLRTDSTEHGAARLLKAITEGNAAAVIPFGPERPARNVAVFANAADVRALDAVYPSETTGDLRSTALGSAGMPRHNEFFSREGTSGRGMEPIAVRTQVNRILSGFSVKPDVVIARNLAELQEHPDFRLDLMGYEEGDVSAFLDPKTGKIYLVASQMSSPDEVATALTHEYITHYGLRAAFGDKYQEILDGVAKAMPADVRQRGESEYGPERYDPKNPRHASRAAEETLAYYGQQYAKGQSVPGRMRRWLDRFRAMIRDWMRNVLGLPKKFDELFVKRTLGDLEAFLRRGESRSAAAGAADRGPAFASRQDTFFSGLARAVDAAKREKGTGAEWEATLRNMQGVKAEEMQWTGLKDWLEGRGKVSKQEVADYVNAHRVQLGEAHMGANPEATNKIIDQLRKLGYGVEESVHGEPYLIGLTPEAQDEFLHPPEVNKLFAQLVDGGEAAPVKYLAHSTPGGENYREMLMTLPESREDAAANERAKKSAAARLKAESDSRAAERAFMEFLPEADQVLRANAAHWLYDAAIPRGDVLRDDAIAKLHAAVDKMSPAFRVDARELMGESIAANRVLRAITQEDIKAQAAVKHGGNFVHSHWDTPNVLAHIRFDDRTGPNGERVLHLHEVQSDWHQAGRREGYRPQKEAELAKLIKRRDEIEALGRAASSDLKQEWANAMNRIQELGSGGVGVPDAPFKTTWPELAIKRMLRYAAENGYDALSWDTGDTNADRYNMSHVVDLINVRKNLKTGTYDLVAKKDGKTLREEYDLTDEKLAQFIGKDAAQKAISRGEDGDVVPLVGNDLKIGGHGMRGFYDDILPKTVQKMVKKFGSSVEPGEVSGGGSQTFDVLAHSADSYPQSHNVALADVETTARNHAAETPGVNFTVRPSADQKGGYGVSLEDGKWWAYMPDDTKREFPTAKAALEAVNGAEMIPAHMVKITPQMRDSVLQGQPMFLKRRPKGTPPPPRKGVIPAAYGLARKAVAAIPASELNQSLRRIVDPAGVSEVAASTAIRLRESLGELAQSREEAIHHLEQFSKTFDTMATKDRYDFIDDMEEGRPQRNPELQPAADMIRKLLDGWREKIRGLGIGALDNFIENYFPHIWMNDKEAKTWLGKIFGRRPLKGPASFLKERTIPTTREGLEAGLEPISSNPLILTFAKLSEMQKFYNGVKFVQGLKDEKLAVFKPAFKKMPDDWVKIEDAVGRVLQWSEVEQGFIERGHYIMPADAGRIVNNHLSASALRNFLPAQVFRVASNAVNALQLGFSGFHLGFTTLDAIVSRNAIGIERLLHGEPLRAAQAFLEAATGPGAAIANIARGQRLRKAYGNMAAASPEMRRIVEGLMAAGGRIKMDRYFMAAQGISPFKGVGFATLASDVRASLRLPVGKVEALTKTLTSFPQQYAVRLWRDMQEIWRTEPFKLLPVMSGMEIAGRVTRASTSVIMEHIVPLQKLGVFSDLAADHIRRNPNEDSVAFADAMQKIWDTVDDRLGEMVYDNVFWNRTFKDVNHMMIRAVGWNLGTVRVLGGAPIDVVKLLDYMAQGAPAQLKSESLSQTAQARLDYEKQKSTLQRLAEKAGHKIPYTLALIGTTMVAGAILQYLLTGERPKEVKDYFFPRTGRNTKYGTPERISLPSYMKDIYEYSTQPATTVMNKANPIFGIIHAIYANEDFFGNAVRNPDDNIWRQMLQGAQYAAREVLPFSIQGGKQFLGAGENDTKAKVLAAAPYFGLTPAPARVTSPEQMDRYQLRETEKSYIRGLQYRLKQAMEKHDVGETNRLRDEIRDAKLKERGTERDIRTDKIKARDAADKISGIVEGKNKSDAVAALKAAGYPAFAQLWESMPERPRPRVSESLEEFA